MKKLLYVFVAIVTIVANGFSQDFLNYQAIVRDKDGGVVSNQLVSLRLSVLAEKEDGVVSYQETHSLQTNYVGLINLKIGEGTATEGDFSKINWNKSDHYLKVELDVKGGSNFAHYGTQNFTSVPYAYHAKSANTIDDPENPVIGIGNPQEDPNGALFAVKNAAGDTIFAVYDGGVRIYVDDAPLKASSKKAGFAVGGLRAQKATTEPENYLIVTPDSARIYFREETGLKASSKKAGFAVGGYRAQKASIGGLTNLLTVSNLETNVYTAQESGSFGIRSTGETGDKSYLTLDPQNYRIGQDAGSNISTGFYNFFAGHEAGKANTTGYYNVFLGPESGITNTHGRRNIFIGYKAGNQNIGENGTTSSTIGHDNIYIGTQTGQNIPNGEHNTQVGSMSGIYGAGTKNTFVGAFTGLYATGTSNAFFGVDAGRMNNAGNNNVFLGAIAGNNCSGSNNTFVGFGSGYNNTSGTGNVFLGYYAGLNEMGSNKLYIDNSATSNPLIWGDFSANTLRINGKQYVATALANNFAAEFFNDGNSSNRYGIRVQAGDDNGVGTNYIYSVYNGSGSYEGGIILLDGVIQLSGTSDRRLKQNIAPTQFNALDIVNNLTIYDYAYIKNPDVTHTGYVAQDVLNVFPNMVTYNETEDVYGVTPMTLIPLLNRAIQQQQEQINELKKSNEELRSALGIKDTEKQSYESRIAQLEKTVQMLLDSSNLSEKSGDF